MLKEIPKIYRNAFYSCFLSSFIFLLVIGVNFVYVPFNINRLDLNESDFAFGIFIFGIFNLITNQIVGRFFIPRFGTKNVMLMGYSLISFCPFLLFYVEQYALFLLVWIPFGIAVAFMMGGSQTLISLIEHKTNQILTPLYQSAFNIGSIAGGALAGILIWLKFTPEYIFFTLGILVTFNMVLIYKLGLSKENEFKYEKTPFKPPSYDHLKLGIMLMVYFGSLGIIIDWSALWITKDLLAPPFLGGLVIIFFNIGQLIAKLMAVQLIKLTSEKFIGGYLVFIGSTFYFFSILLSDLYTIVAISFVFGFSISNFVAILIRFGVKLSPNNIPVTISNINSIGFSGFAFGPLLVGYSAENIGLTFNMLTLCIVWGINGLVLAYFIRNDQNKYLAK